MIEEKTIAPVIFRKCPLVVVGDSPFSERDGYQLTYPGECLGEMCVAYDDGYCKRFEARVKIKRW